jgi:DNA primase
MSLSPAFLDELRARTTLSTLIGKTVKVTKAGREFKACCPFHNEKTPSFTINDDKGFYHCFGCGAHGDAIRWMTDQRGLPFMDAVKELAAAANLEVPALDRQSAERQQRANSLHDVMAAAADWFRAQLAEPGGAEARAYLERRGLSRATIERFAIGYAPDSRGKLRAALARFGDEMLIEAGLLILVEGKEPYDRFRGRVMIPIRDARGRVIAFGGRILGDGEPKYLNSPDTPLFDKGRTLYNIDLALPVARKSNRIIVVEGYMDVIALAQAGVGDAVAPLGTALTEQHLERLWRIAEVPMLCFDGDSAGQKAAIRAAHRALPMLQPGHSLQFLTLPQGQDPDDLVRAGGAGAFERLVQEAEPLVNRLWAHELAAGQLTTPEERAGLKQRLNELANAIQHPDIRQQYREEYRRRFDERFGWQPRQPAPARGFTGRAGPSGRAPGRFGGWQAPRPVGAATLALAQGGVTARFTRAVLEGLARHPACIPERAEAIAAMPVADQRDDALRHALLDLAFSGEKLEPERVVTILEQKGVYGIGGTSGSDKGLAFSFLRGKAESGRAQRDLLELIDALAERAEIAGALEDAGRRFTATMDEASFAEQQRLRAALQAAETRLADLVQDTGSGA